MDALPSLQSDELRSQARMAALAGYQPEPEGNVPPLSPVFRTWFGFMLTCLSGEPLSYDGQSGDCQAHVLLALNNHPVVIDGELESSLCHSTFRHDARLPRTGLG